jgi:hypothetical protein
MILTQREDYSHNTDRKTKAKAYREKATERKTVMQNLEEKEQKNA